MCGRNVGMTLSHLARRTMAPLALAILLLPSTATAHKGHKDNMSEAEMVQMEMQEASDMHDEDGEAQDDSTSIEKEDPSTEGVAEPMTAEQALDAAVAENRVTSTGDLVGRLHPMAAHFPVALLLMAALAEFLLVLRPSLGLETTVRFLVAGGATGAVVAALLGWFAAGWRLQDRSETLGIHRWNGTAIAAVSLLSTWLAFRSGKRTTLRIALAALAVALIIQGYLGAEMVFGPNHLGLE